MKTFLAESLFCFQWDVSVQAVILHEKRWNINIYDPLIMVIIKSTSMNQVNVLVRFNQLLWYFRSFPHIQYRHPPSPLPSQKKKISGFENNFFFISSTLLYWPNSAFFNFQKNVNQDHCRQYSCILFLINKLEQRTWRRENLSLNRVFSQVGQ